MMDKGTSDFCRAESIRTTAEAFRLAVQRGEKPWEKWSQNKPEPEPGAAVESDLVEMTGPINEPEPQGEEGAQ